MFIIVFGFVVGFPTYKDIYVEASSKKSKINFVEASGLGGKITFIPEVLNRLIIEINFLNSRSGDFIIKDMDIECHCNSNRKNIDRIFDIRISKYDPHFDEYNFDDIGIEESYDELPLNSKYRDLSYTVTPQFQMDNCKNFQLNITVSIVDTLAKDELKINKSFTIEKDKVFKWEHFRAH
jgi:hypothetical protein